MAVETFYICDWCEVRAPAADDGYAPSGWTDENPLGRGALLCEGCIDALMIAAAKVQAEREKIAWERKRKPPTPAHEAPDSEAVVCLGQHLPEDDAS